MSRPIKYKPELLQIGERLPIAAKKWNRFQYAFTYSERLKPMKFEAEWEANSELKDGGQVYLKRIA